MTDVKPRSARSQRSLLRQHELQHEFDEHDRQAQGHRKKISELEASKTSILHSLSRRGNTVGLENALRGKNEALTDTGDRLAHAEAELARLKADIKKLDLSPAKAKARAEQQAAFASLAAERLEKDREAEKAVAELRGVLQERAGLSSKMAACASALDFALGDDGLDTARIEQLLAALPGSLAADSERWAARLHGERAGAVTYVVRDKVLVVPETLAHHGVYHRGDKIELTEAEARDLLSERPAPTHEAPWRRAAPRIVTAEAYAEASGRAAQTGISVEDAWAHENFFREKQAREAWEPVPRAAPAQQSVITV